MHHASRARYPGGWAAPQGDPQVFTGGTRSGKEHEKPDHHPLQDMGAQSSGQPGHFRQQGEQESASSPRSNGCSAIQGPIRERTARRTVHSGSGMIPVLRDCAPRAEE